MNTIEILSRLEKVKFTTEQARTMTEIIEDRQYQLATKDDVKMLKDDLKANYIATKDDVKTVKDDLKTVKDDLKANYIATKEDIKNVNAKMATKDDLKTVKDDLKNVNAKMATKDDLKILATKDGLQAEILKSKYDLVKWIVGGLIANGLLTTLLKYYG